MLENIISSPVSTIKGLSIATMGLLSHYNVLSPSDATVWGALIYSIISIFFQKDNSTKRVGGGSAGTPKP